MIEFFFLISFSTVLISASCRLVCHFMYVLNCKGCEASLCLVLLFFDSFLKFNFRYCAVLVFAVLKNFFVYNRFKTDL